MAIHGAGHLPSDCTRSLDKASYARVDNQKAANKKLVPDDPLFSLGKAEITLENSGVDSILLPRGNFKQVVPTDGVTEFEPLGVTVEDLEQPLATSAPVEERKNPWTGL